MLISGVKVMLVGRCLVMSWFRLLIMNFVGLNGYLLDIINMMLCLLGWFRLCSVEVVVVIVFLICEVSCLIM